MKIRGTFMAIRVFKHIFFLRTPINRINANSHKCPRMTMNNLFAQLFLIHSCGIDVYSCSVADIINTNLICQKAD